MIFFFYVISALCVFFSFESNIVRNVMPVRENGKSGSDFSEHVSLSLYLSTNNHMFSPPFHYFQSMLETNLAVCTEYKRMNE